MNECEQTHPMLRGYLEDSLSARDRRVVARHLNLCASARKELDRLRSGPMKSPVSPSNQPSEPWDLKVLSWIFKTKKPLSSPKAEEAPKKPKAAPKSAPTQAASAPGKKSSALKPLLGIFVFFLALVFLTHFVQNASENSTVKGIKRWLSKNGALGVTPSLDLVLDLTNLPHWSGKNAPFAGAYQGFVTDEDRFRVYWGILQANAPEPIIDFNKNALAVVFVGPKATAGNVVRFKVMKNYSDKTLLEYDEVAPPPSETATAINNSWIIQVVPKPAQTPVVIQKIQ